MLNGFMDDFRVVRGCNSGLTIAMTVVTASEFAL
jgi:hypothetical protein